MSGPFPLLAALATAYLLAAIAPPVLRLSGRWGRAIALAAAVAPLLLPLIVPSEKIDHRAIVSFLCVDLALKMVDYARVSRRSGGAAICYGEYLRFLTPIPLLLVRLR